MEQAAEPVASQDVVDLGCCVVRKGWSGVAESAMRPVVVLMAFVLADVALLCEGDDVDGLQAVPLLREAQVALLPAGHRLAGRPAVTTGELRREEGFRERCPTTALGQIVDRVVLDGLIVIVAGSSGR